MNPSETQQDSRAVPPSDGHKLHDREDGLHHCMVCGGAEGSMPTHCPGVRMTAEQESAVYDGRLNYALHQWWVPQAADLAAAPSLPESPQPPDVHLGRGDDEGASLASEVRPCPFCGNSGLVDPRHTYSRTPEHQLSVRCGECGAQGPWEWDRGVLPAWKATNAAWNRRAPSVQPAVEVRKARMLTRDEEDAAWNIATRQGTSIAASIIREFCFVNGIAISGEGE